MSDQRPSAYTAFSLLLQGCANPVSPAELHGFLLGRSAAGAGFDAAEWLGEAGQWLGGELDERMRQALVGLQEMVRGELTGEDVALVLMLPGDDAPLAERTAALGQWCQGFLSGFGLVAGNRLLGKEASEVLQDLAAIAQIDGADEESEAGEVDYMEVMEYLRVAPLLLFAECAPATPPAPKPSLH